MKKDFKYRLKFARKLRNLTQEKLAKKAGLHISEIAHFEIGTRKPDFNNIKKLSKALKTQSDFLFGLTNNKPESSKTEKGNEMYFEDICVQLKFIANVFYDLNCSVKDVVTEMRAHNSIMRTKKRNVRKKKSGKK